MDTSPRENNQYSVGCLVAGEMISQASVQQLQRRARKSRNVFNY